MEMKTPPPLGAEHEMNCDSVKAMELPGRRVREAPPPSTDAVHPSNTHPSKQRCGREVEEVANAPPLPLNAVQ